MTKSVTANTPFLPLTHMCITLSTASHHSSLAQTSKRSFSFQIQSMQLYTYKKHSGKASSITAQWLMKFSHFSASIGSNNNPIMKAPARYSILSFSARLMVRRASSVMHNTFLRGFTRDSVPSSGWQWQELWFPYTSLQQLHTETHLKITSNVPSSERENQPAPARPQALSQFWSGLQMSEVSRAEALFFQLSGETNPLYTTHCWTDHWTAPERNKERLSLHPG